MDKARSIKRTVHVECDAIIFDLDGVLIDSVEGVMRHWRKWALERHVDLAQILRVMHGRRTVETMRLVAPHLCVEEDASRFAASEAADMQGITAIDGASLLLDSLPPGLWAIATSGTRDVAIARLRHVGLPVPRILVTAGDVARGKPNPEPYLAAAEGLGVVAERCVVIEDSPAGIESACSAGMQTVGVATTHSPHDLGRALIVVRSLHDIQIAPGRRRRLLIRIERHSPLHS